MYTINIYEEDSLLQSLSSNFFNFSIQKQKGVTYTVFRVETEIADLIACINQLLPKLQFPVTIELVINNNTVLTYQSKLLENVSIDGLDESHGISITLRMD